MEGHDEEAGALNFDNGQLEVPAAGGAADSVNVERARCHQDGVGKIGLGNHRQSFANGMACRRNVLEATLGAVKTGHEIVGCRKCLDGNEWVARPWHWERVCVLGTQSKRKAASPAGLHLYTIAHFRYQSRG